VTLFVSIAKKPRKCHGDKSHVIPGGMTCFVQTIPTVKTKRGFTLYSAQSFCLDCGMKILGDIESIIEKLKVEAKKVKV
jgi:hypothetical protein